VSAGPHQFPSRGHRGLWLRFAAAVFAVVALVAAATATAGLLGVQSFVDDLNRGHTIKSLNGIITKAPPGKPQTLLLIGSDHRANAGAHDARSDTMILVRLDPHANATTVLSIPRDLKVDFRLPSGAMRFGAKINETYTDGGEALTAKVIKGLLRIEINHVVNINFKGFREVVDAIGCVYADVDHRYYHSNLGLAASQQYAEIDLPAGYQKLCGQQALDYVRYRHTDSDFVRAARQQDFLRQIKSQYGLGKLAADPHQLTRTLGPYLSTDADLHSIDALLKLADLVAFSASKPIREVHFPPAYLNERGGSYVTATPQALARVRHAFLSPPPKVEGAGGGASAHGGRGGARHRRGRPGGPSTAGLVSAKSLGESYAIQLGGVGFPVYYPALLTANGRYMPPMAGQYPRAYRLRDLDGRLHAAYRLVVAAGDAGNYYGVQGATWTDPPILRNPSADRRTVNGKHLLLFYDGDRLRLVAWRAHGAAYWISNTLQEELTNDQMLAIAGSLTRLGR
jgi:polyisoprenyl-teichoic acid--peptidoglycan teichoic acid transferase